jgi:hypothetical protein
MLERAAALVIAAVAVVYLTQALALPFGTTARPGAGFFPTLVAVLGVGVAVLMTARAFRAARPAVVPAAAAGARTLMPWLGYPLVAFGFVAVLLRRLGGGWRGAVLTGALSAVVSFYLFAVLLDVPLPRGPW